MENIERLIINRDTCVGCGLPTVRQPISSTGTFNAMEINPIGIFSLSRLISVASPVIPPATIPLGATNITVPAA